jgi:hypothetical protein
MPLANELLKREALLALKNARYTDVLTRARSACEAQVVAAITLPEAG